MPHLVPSTFPQHPRRIINENDDIVILQQAEVDRPAFTFHTIEQTPKTHGQTPSCVSWKEEEVVGIYGGPVKDLCQLSKALEPGRPASSEGTRIIGSSTGGSP